MAPQTLFTAIMNLPLLSSLAKNDCTPAQPAMSYRHWKSKTF